MCMYGGREFSAVEENAGTWRMSLKVREDFGGKNRRKKRVRLKERSEQASEESNRILRRS